MRIDDAQRLVHLVRHFKQNMLRSHSLARRITRLLDECPGDDAIRESTLDALEIACDASTASVAMLLLAARAPCEQLAKEPDDETHDGRLDQEGA